MLLSFLSRYFPKKLFELGLISRTSLHHVYLLHDWAWFTLNKANTTWIIYSKGHVTSKSNCTACSAPPGECTPQFPGLSLEPPTSELSVSEFVLTVGRLPFRIGYFGTPCTGLSNQTGSSRTDRLSWIIYLERKLNQEFDDLFVSDKDLTNLFYYTLSFCNVLNHNFISQYF